ncbi:uncharacterized protein LOC120330900 [Styela clava]
MMLVEDESSKNPVEESSSTKDESSPSNLTDLHCHQQHARNERLLNIRKLKSRNAARTRRGKENYEFYELAKLLPIPVETSSQLDKASIIRLTMSFLKLREFNFCVEPQWNLVNEGPPPNRTVKDASRSVKSALQQVAMTKIIEEQLGSRILQSLDGFMFVLNCSGRFLYVSESVSIFLGLSQVEMIGSSIFDYTYPDDRNELAVHLSVMLSPSKTDDVTMGSNNNTKKQPEKEKNCIRSFFIRMKSTLTKRGVTPKSSYYKVVHMCTRSQCPPTKRNGTKNLTTRSDCNNLSKDSNATHNPIGLIGFGASLPPYSLSELPLHENIFTMRVNPTLNFTYCDPAIEDMLGYNVRDVVGQSFYHSIHAGDVNKIKKCHIELLTKGHVRTPYYRWMHKSGGYRWIYSSITLLANQRLYPEQSFIWINNVISGICEENQVIDLFQFPQEEIDRRKNLLEKQKLTEAKTKSKVKKSSNEKDSKKTKLCKNKKEETSETSSEDNNIISEKSSTSKDFDESSSTDCNNNSVTIDEKYQNQKHPICQENLDATSKRNSKRKLSTIESAIPGGKERRNDNEASEITETRMPQNDGETDNVNTIKTSHDKTSNAKQSGQLDKESRLKSDSAIENDANINKPNDGSGVKIYCMATDFSGVKIAAKHLAKPIIYADSVSEYMDVDSTMWANPPNKEISNHNDLPPGIKQMPGLWFNRQTQTPSAVHHHYPFGINPNLLHSNPLLAKIMMAGWAGHRLPGADTFMVTAPVQLMSPIRLPENMDEGNFAKCNAASQASVAAVLEELKKDPLHKVNPPNKVVLPSLHDNGLNKSTIISGSKNLLHSVPCFNMGETLSDGKTMLPNTSNQTSSTGLPSRALTTLNLYTNEVLNQHVRAQTVIQVPSTILVPTNSMVFNSTEHPPLLALNSDNGLKLPIPSTPFQQHVNPCVIQPFSFPQVPKVPF